MKVNYRTFDGAFTFELDASKQSDAFREVAQIQEVFEEPTCGVCGGESIQFVTRTVSKEVTDEKTKKKKMEDYEYFEKVCRNPECRAKLSYGLHNNQKGTMFPKRKGEDGKFDYKHRGWVKWQGKKDVQPAAATENVDTPDF